MENEDSPEEALPILERARTKTTADVTMTSNRFERMLLIERIFNYVCVINTGVWFVLLNTLNCFM